MSREDQAEANRVGKAANRAFEKHLTEMLRKKRAV